MRTTFMLVVFLSAAVRGVLSPPDPCKLLTPADIMSVTGKTRFPTGVSSTMPAGMGTACQYTWGIGAGPNPAGVRSDLQVITGEAAKQFPGMSPATIKQGLVLNATEIPGVGDFAVVTSDDVTRVKATAYVKGLILQVVLEGPGARDKQDKVIAILKAAAGRL